MSGPEFAAFENDWVPTDYLAEYYTTDQVAPDEEAIYSFLLETLRRENQRFAKAIEFGCGPTIHHSLALAPWVEELHLSDYLPGNLEEVSKWLRSDPGAHNWEVYLRGILGREGISVTPETIEERAQLLRARVTTLKQGDIRQADPLGDGAHYDLVASFYCADSITKSKDEWHRYILNLISLLAPGGLLLFSMLHEAQSYAAGPRRFPSANVNASDVDSVLRAGGLNPASLDVRVVQFTGWEEEGFDAVCLASARLSEKLTCTPDLVQRLS